MMRCDSLCHSKSIASQHVSSLKQVRDFFSNVFSTSYWPARWHCGNWSSFHGWLYIFADLSIWLSYFTIPFLLFHIVKKRNDLPFSRIFWLFILFILFCGATHFMDAIMFWWPAYRLSALVLLATGVVSVFTVFALIRVLPAILKLRTIEQLEIEIKERQRAQQEMRHMQVLKQAADDLNIKKDEFMAQLTVLNKGLEFQAKQLAISNAELEQFAYVASHDLQEPLRMVTSFMTLLEHNYGEKIDDQGKQYIHFAVDGAKRMRNIILDLLDFSKVGRTDDQMEEINVNDLISDILALFRTQIDEKQAAINYSGLPVLFTFKAPLQQVFQNIISNALKYQPEGNIPIIDISYEEMPEHWQFSIKDNGIGIDPQYFEKIFIIFQRLHRKEEYVGTGMGLSLTKKIVENMGGRIWVTSEEGKGSTFTFTILKGN